jgi:hypothetical protein
MIVSLVLGCGMSGRPCYSADGSWSGHLEIVKQDFKTFYLESDTLVPLAVSIGAAGVLANGSADGDIQDYYQDHIRNGTTDSVSKVFSVIGSPIVVPAVLVATHLIIPESPADDWAKLSLRAIIVGAPAGLFLQRATGGDRPSEGPSDWKFFQGDDGLSGHAFVGGVPFITAAKISQSTLAKGLFYALSIFPALSRINDNEHYFSQAALGWSLAYLSCEAVDRSTRKRQTTISIVPLPMEAGGSIQPKLLGTRLSSIQSSPNPLTQDTIADRI